MREVPLNNSESLLFRSADPARSNTEDEAKMVAERLIRSQADTLTTALGP